MRGKGEGSVYKDSRGLWTGSIELPSHDGTRRRKVIRRKLKKDLLTELAAARAELKLRGDLPTDGQTVEQWFTYWYYQIAKKAVRHNTLKGYKSVVFGWVIPTIGNVKMEKVTATHIRRVYDRMEDVGLSSTYALLAHRAMAVSFKYAVREGRIGRNPTDLTDAPRKAASKLQALNLDEALQLLAHVADDEVMGARWATALLTGARRGEVIGLEWDRVGDVLDLSWQLQRIELTKVDGKPDVPADTEYRHLRGGLYLTRPKSSKGWRIIPLTDPLKSILERHRAANADNEWGLVFTSRYRHHPIDPARDTNDWQKLLLELEIDKRVRLHDVRHTTVDLLAIAGLRDDEIMAIVGHSTRAMTQEYKSRYDKERLRASMEKYALLFTKPTGDTPQAIAG